MTGTDAAPPGTSCPSAHTCFLFAAEGNDERRKGTGPKVRARGDSPVERSTKLPVSSSHQRSTSQRCVANHAFTTCYTTQPTAAAYDHMEREEPRARFRDTGYLTVELKGRSVASKIAEAEKTTKQQKHYWISG